MLDFQVFIATYNRPDLICNTIDSILLQKGWDFELIISDNSTNNETSKIINEKYGNSIRYIKREPSVDVISHLNLILNDVTLDYFMIFHDDDTMNDGMLETVRKAFSNNPSLISIGCNANTIKNNQISKTWFLKDTQTDQLISDGTQMAARYLVPNQIVPFPSYIYKSTVAKNIRFDNNKGGKYSDVAFIIDVANSGNILLIAQPLMNYFIHKGQDSFTNDFVARLKLTNYISTETDIDKNHKALKAFRLKNIYKDNLSVKKLEFSGLFRKRAKLLIHENDYLSYMKLIILTVLSKFK